MSYKEWTLNESLSVSLPLNSGHNVERVNDKVAFCTQHNA